MECGDLSPLSAGDLSLSKAEAGSVPPALSAWASLELFGHSEPLDLDGDKSLVETGENSPHSIPQRPRCRLGSRLKISLASDRSNPTQRRRGRKEAQSWEAKQSPKGIASDREKRTSALLGALCISALNGMLPFAAPLGIGETTPCSPEFSAT